MTAEDQEAGETARITARRLYREAQDHAALQGDYDVQAGLDRFTAWMQDNVAGRNPEGEASTAGRPPLCGPR